ncbi:MAG: sigma-54-dependent Fis family transcriptional regulator [Bacteroidales bacterium]|nr:sigma-54-dependent Fis family transcriptional regulator [Bacteroidales bacterium]
MKKDRHILIVDDNKAVTIALKLLIKSEFSQVDVLTNPNTLISKISKQAYDAIILDMNFVSGINTGNEGFFWLNEILKIDPDASIIFITAYAEIERAVMAIHEGAVDYVEKPWDDKKLLSSINKAIERRDARKEIKRLKNNQKHINQDIRQQFQLIKGESPAMKEVYDSIYKVSETDANVLLLGENGTGKEIIAREIHYQSNRKNEMFINVDMASLNEQLFESEMFGHVKGAFTDAKEDRIGRFELASNGTLFLDEITNLPINLQSKLLVALQNREISSVGSSFTKAVDIRLITASNKDVSKLIDKGEFREDLFYRINTVSIKIPPLRERREDIPALISFFMEKYKAKYQHSSVKTINFPLNQFATYNWPGNIRELQHLVEKFIILGNIDLNKNDTQKKIIAISETESLNIDEHEKMLIYKALEKTGWKYQETAQELGIARRTLYNKMKKYGF